MIKKVLGRTGFEVTALGLGCYKFTTEFKVPMEIADEITDYAIRHGVNIFDTAAQYGFGESEWIVGRALARHPGKRIYVNDKVGTFGKTLARKWGDDAFTDPMEIMRIIKHSLWSLRKDHFDMLSIHEPDWLQWGFNYDTGESVIMEIVEGLKKEGLVENIGLGGWNQECITKLIETDKIDVLLYAGGVNLLTRPLYRFVIPAAQKHNVGIMLGGGFGQNNPYLTAIRRDELYKLYETDNSDLEIMAKKLEKIYDIAEELNMNMFELTIRYILALDEIHVHVPGASKVEHIKANLDYAERGPLSQSYVNDINKIQKLGDGEDVDIRVLMNALKK